MFSKPVWQSAIVLLVGAIVAPGKRTISVSTQTVIAEFKKIEMLSEVNEAILEEIDSSSSG